MNLELDDLLMMELQELFNSLDTEESIFMNHYELAKMTGKKPSDWKQFLMHPAVVTWINQEIQLFKEYQLKQMIKNATDNDKSVGAAQMINSLTKSLSESQVKTGPVIIYTHVPLTEDQREGTTIETIELDENILEGISDDWRNMFNET